MIYAHNVLQASLDSLNKLVKEPIKTLEELQALKNRMILGNLSLRETGGSWLGQNSDNLTPKDIYKLMLSD